MALFKSENARNAARVGGLCSVAYLSVYIARNILGAATPQMIETGLFTAEYIGRLSSLYLSLYAIGQLINGMWGDRIKARYMISIGLMMAGFANFAFSRMTALPEVSIIAYGLSGFFLSMIYGPMTKVVAENTQPPYTTRCSLGYTFASMLGTPLAGLLAAALMWRHVFAFSSVALWIMSAMCFFFFLRYERSGIVRYGRFSPGSKDCNPVKTLIKRDILRFAAIAALTGIIRTAVVFWMPTYISQRLGFSPENAALLFTVASFIIALSPFISIFLYERLKYNMYLTIQIMFSSSLIFFILVYLTKSPVLNLACLVAAIMASNCCSTMMYSRYCPGLKDTGYVSSATGFLDFVSYAAASASSAIFANAVSAIGWNNLVIAWGALMLCGVIISLPWSRILRRGASA